MLGETTFVSLIFVARLSCRGFPISTSKFYSKFNSCIKIKPSSTALVFPHWVFRGQLSKNNGVIFLCVFSIFLNFQHFIFRSVFIVKKLQCD